MAVNFKSEKEVKEYLENLGIEYRFSCYKEDNPEGCHLLGDYLEAVKKDFVKAANVYKRNCDAHKFGKSCHKYGAYSLVGKGCKQDFEKAMHYFSHGCDNGSPEACLGAGVLALSPGSASYDAKKGVSFLERGCEANEAKSCFHASGVYIKGVKGKIETDFAKAFRFALKGCELGHHHACANLSQMYRKGDGVEKNEILAEKYKKDALEMQEQLKNNFHQIKFGS